MAGSWIKRIMVGVALVAGAAGPSSAQLGMVTLDVRVPKRPIPVTSDGQAHLVYELRATNIGLGGYAVQRLEVTSGDRTLASWDGSALRSIALRMGERGDGRIIGPGRQALFYLMVSVPVGAVPETLNHRIHTTHADSVDGPAGLVVNGPAVAVDRTAPIQIRSPLKGGPWAAMNGPGNLSGHRRTVIPLDGEGRIAQRFATDWIKLGPDGRAWQGDSTVNANWYGYGDSLVAVGAGTVVAVKDGIIENVPLSPTMAVPITLETVAGNHVIIDLGGGNYAFYAHIVPGSVAVKLGDRVKPGQLVGLLGNSGNSTAPHLHFHIGDRPTPLGAEGIPFVLDEYVKLGVMENLLSPWTNRGAEQTKRGETPFENHVTQFRP